MIRVRAVRFDSEFDVGGRSRPLLMECESEDGDSYSVVVKIVADDRDLDACRLVREVVTARLAGILGLPHPVLFRVEISDDLIEAFEGSCPGISGRLQLHRELAKDFAFGCEYLPGYSLASGDSLRKEQLPLAAEIFAFDALTLNRDRCIPLVGNPNCLAKGADLMLIDHEQALDADYVDGNDRLLPWKVGSLADMCGQLEHIFYRRLHGKPNDLARIRDAWADVKADDVDSLFDDIPRSWDVSGAERRKVSAYLGDLAANLDAAFDEVTRVLA